MSACFKPHRRLFYLQLLKICNKFSPFLLIILNLSMRNLLFRVRDVINKMLNSPDHSEIIKTYLRDCKKYLEKII